MQIWCRFDADLMQVWCRFDADLMQISNLHQICVTMMQIVCRLDADLKSASNLHQICIKSASNLHQICTKSASNLHQICTKSASNLHQLFISFHQTCTSETLKTYLDIVFETGKDDVLGNLKYRYMISSLSPKHTLNMFFSQLQNPHVQTHVQAPHVQVQKYIKLHEQYGQLTGTCMSQVHACQVRVHRYRQGS